jgi:tetratricopeptide (TPR) repeat protein
MRSKLISFSCASALLVITTLNISAYQQTPPLLNSIINRNHVSDALILVKKLAYTPFYKDQVTYFSSYYGDAFTNLYAQDQTAYARKKEILEKQLEQNPLSPPLLSTVAFLSYKIGQKSEAFLYYEKAKKIDPNVSIIPENIIQ